MEKHTNKDITSSIVNKKIPGTNYKISEAYSSSKDINYDQYTNTATSKIRIFI